MKYVLLITLLVFSASAMASGNKSTAQQKVWTDVYQYGAKENKTPQAAKKPTDKNGEFEIAPKQ